MKRFPLWPFFLLSLFFVFYASAFMPNNVFFPFVPFLLLAFSRFSLVRSLYLAAGCGFILDCLSSELPLGFFALCHTLVTYFLYRIRLFFVEKSLGLSSYTFIFSLSLTLVQRIFMAYMGVSFPWTLWGCVTDFILMPLLDSCYAFLWFSCPIMVYHFARKKWFHFLFLRKESKRKKAEPLKKANG